MDLDMEDIALAHGCSFHDLAIVNAVKYKPATKVREAEWSTHFAETLIGVNFASGIPTLQTRASKRKTWTRPDDEW